MIDFLIIGAGISGLNLGLKLKEEFENKSVSIFEMYSFVGGRIQTKQIKDYNTYLEAGAARFNDKQKNFNHLLKKLNLHKNKIKIPSKNNYIDITTKKKNTLNFNNILQKLLIKSKQIPTKQLFNMTLKDLLIKFFDKKIVNYFTNYFSYYSEINVLNAERAIDMFKKDFNEKIKFFKLKNGLSSIIKKLKLDFLKKGGKLNNDKKFINFKIIKDSHFECVFENDKKKYKCKNLILAIPKQNLLKIPNLKIIKPMLNSVLCKPLYRIYAVYPKNKNGKVWFHDISNTTTNEKIKFIIPIDYKKGLILISYTDGKYTNIWRNYKLMNKIEEEITKSLKKVFPNKNIPKAKEYFHYYWKTGACYWKKGVDAKKIHKKILKPFKNKNIYICGSNYSLNQAWSEGALDTSNKVFKMIKKMN